MTQIWDSFIAEMRDRRPGPMSNAYRSQMQLLVDEQRVTNSKLDLVIDRLDQLVAAVNAIERNR